MVIVIVCAQRVARDFVTATAGARWVITAGIACASWAGEEQAATPPWRHPAVMPKTMTEVNKYKTAIVCHPVCLSFFFFFKRFSLSQLIQLCYLNLLKYNLF